MNLNQMKLLKSWADEIINDIDKTAKFLTLIYILQFFNLALILSLLIKTWGING
jgi:hypothetical protein